MKLPGSNEYISGGLIGGNCLYKTTNMRVLRIYSLEGKGLSEDECNRIKKFTETDVIIHMTANNQLENVQYPVFEFETIYEEPKMTYEIQNNTLNKIREQAIKMSERKI